MQLLDGKKILNEIKAELAAEVEGLVKTNQRRPHLAAILVGNDGASQTYVASKEKNCRDIGFNSTVFRLDESVSEIELLELIQNININPEIDGLIVQLPLPSNIQPQKVIDAISPEKDIDGFNTLSTGKLTKGQDTFLPATPFGIVQLLQRYHIDVQGKHCVIIGRSDIVGRPLSILLSQNSKYANATVTLCHSRTPDIGVFAKQADILVAALGKPEFITADMVKMGAIVIDVGITRIEDSSRKSGYRLAGDVKFDEVAPKCSYITPVPGGVGLMTIASLLMNTMKAYKLNLKQAQN